MRVFPFSMLHRPHAAARSSTQSAIPANALWRTRMKRVVWFVTLWCAGVAGAMLLALPFRLLMKACMQ